jgi:hypothetical protein
VANQAAVQRAAGKRRDGLAQAAQDVVERQEGRRLNSTAIASSASVSTVLRGCPGPIGALGTPVRACHFATVFAFRP